MFRLKLAQIGNSVGVILPEEFLNRFHLEKGNTIYAIESPEGVCLTPFNPKVEKRMEIARQIMKSRRDVLRELAD